MAELSSMLKVKNDDLVTKVKALLSELKDKEKEIEAYKQAAAEAGAKNVLEQIEAFPSGKGLVANMGNMDMNGLRETADRLKEGRSDLALVLFAIDHNKVSIVVTAGKDWQGKGLQAGRLIKEIAPIVGGGGGGRPDMAQAGGKDTSKVAEAMAKAKELLGAI